ncbi:hypothetical protein AVEN_77882-1 [Araneus ventricosus]|uniref:Uncharacterized protein n=1 Tax=Araneus ventricosus TaxID=182803 RepID=A0A4Y2V957_ARAVE|nr:hypothetical protein AVEN_77882-1 [Araneus ventricosus]
MDSPRWRSLDEEEILSLTGLRQKEREAFINAIVLPWDSSSDNNTAKRIRLYLLSNRFQFYFSLVQLFLTSRFGDNTRARKPGRIWTAWFAGQMRTRRLGWHPSQLPHHQQGVLSSRINLTCNKTLYH